MNKRLNARAVITRQKIDGLSSAQSVFTHARSNDFQFVSEFEILNIECLAIIC